jgi:enamine deaminase RidA (YjgF/YER057c/UK114 family)
VTRDVIVPPSQQAMYDQFHFAPAVRANGLLLCSGQLGAVNGKVPESAEEEFRNAWNAIGDVLSEADLDFGHIIEYTSFHVNMHEHLGAFMKVRDEFLQAPWPAWTAIGTTGLAIPGPRVEIRVMATL